MGKHTKVWHPAGTSKDFDICDIRQRILISFYNGAYGEFLQGDKVEVMTGLWVGPTQKWYSTIMEKILKDLTDGEIFEIYVGMAKM